MAFKFEEVVRNFLKFLTILDLSEFCESLEESTHLYSIRTAQAFEKR